VVDDAAHLQVGWAIIQNGYELADNAKIIGINGTTLTVNILPNQTSVVVGNPMLFSSSTNYLTLNNDNNLDVGFTAKNNGYDNSQSIIAILGDGQTVQMSAEPGSVPTAGNSIIFTSNANLVTIPAGATVTFIINYTSPGPAGTNYQSTVTINATQLPSTPLTGYIYNYVNVNNPPPPGGTITFTTVYTGGGGGNRPESYTTTVTSFQDGSAYSVTTDQNGTITSYSFQAPDPQGDPDGGDNTGVTSVTSSEGHDPNASGGGTSCFDPMALVTMHDGSHKHIKDVLVGDLVMNQDGSSNTVLDIETPTLQNRLIYSFNKHWAFVSEEHPILTTTGWAAFNPNSWAVEEEFVGKLSKIEIGTEIITKNGTELVTEIRGHEFPEEYVIYNLMLDGDHTYIVENCVVHNKKSIVCTAMNEAYGFGSFRNRIWLRHSEKHLTKAHEVGYHAIFLPLVDYGFKQGDGITHRTVRKILEHIARHRSTDIRADMRGLKRDNIGRIYRSILEPICYLVGKIKGY
jgi:hypothetical protein